ncbi:hypothetical protein ABR737_34325 [Streptomyces sp. Edi2]|uniref:hypothetical protein n=1 Tax=Streptomyces sp. Edi2 TaxID=3162528 RepID=UPI003306297A
MKQNVNGGGAREGVLSAEAATSALRDVAASQGTARLQARLLPAWYGPVSGAVLAVYAIVAVWLLETDQLLVQQFAAWPVALLAVFVIKRAARRSAGVRRSGSAHSVDAREERRKRIFTHLALVVVAACVVGGACWALGAGAQAAVVAAAVAGGLGSWAGIARHNAVIRRQLRELV